MAKNDVIILDTTLQQSRRAVHAELKDDEYFEIFSFEQILKNFDLSYEEQVGGQIGGADDGGIDGFYVFINGDLLEEDTDLSKYRRSPSIDVYLIQSKRAESFAEKPLESLISTCSNIFDLNRQPPDLAKSYSPALVERVSIFRDGYINLALHHPQVNIHFVYATKGDKSEIHPKVRERADQLVLLVQKLITGGHAELNFWGARELVEAAQKQKTYTLQLRLVENPISTDENSYVCLVNLKDYWKFVTDNGVLRKYIFESNVRDWQGDVEVNREISETLSEGGPLNFWWLNNGITVLCSKASLAGKVMSLDDVQIVNGLQTTVTVHEFVKDHGEHDESRSVLVRVIQTDDPEGRDRIIKATNHQTAIPPSSLKATDRIQRDIETYFHQHGWFYDRRKNYYKNLGMPADRIVGIPYLAQAVMAILLKEPDSARARPSTLIKDEENYKRVFNESLGYDLYLLCVQLMKTIELSSKSLAREHQPAELIRNMRFHVATAYVSIRLGKVEYRPTDVKTLVGEVLDPDVLKDAADAVIAAGSNFSDYTDDWSVDRIVKSREFVKHLLSEVSKKLKIPAQQSDGSE